MRNWSSNMKRFSLSYRTHFRIFIFIFMENIHPKKWLLFSVSILTLSNIIVNLRNISTFIKAYNFHWHEIEPFTIYRKQIDNHQIFLCIVYYQRNNFDLKKKKIRYKFDRKNIKTKGSLYRILNRIEYKHIDRHTIHFKQTIETSITR